MSNESEKTTRPMPDPDLIWAEVKRLLAKKYYGIISISTQNGIITSFRADESKDLWDYVK